MARHTRSATNQEKTDDDTDKTTSLSPTSTKSKALPKKRKRNSGVDSDDLPPPKQAREDDEAATVDDEGTDHIEYPPLAGDQPIKEEDAKKILDILEMMDNQGLLDRVFPLEQVLESTSPPTPTSSKTPSDSYSLRALLKEPSEHPLRVYRSAIKQLFPISSQPRAKLSAPAEQQLKFCKIATALIEEASKHTVDGLSLRPEIVNPYPAVTDEISTMKDEPLLGSKRRKYALMQKLPNGEWWTSLSLDSAGTEAELKSFNDLNIGHAELVSILPSPAAAMRSAHTLGDLFNGKQPATRSKPPGPRSISTGTFLDYGPYARFAPVFDSEGAVVGQKGLTSVLWMKHEKSKAREKAKILRERMCKKLGAPKQYDMDVDGVQEIDSYEARAVERAKQKEKAKELLSALYTEDEIKPVINVLDAMELEENVDELLMRNAAALLRLEKLQVQRLGGEKGGSSEVAVDSEEWQTAQHVVDALTLLASLRPRLAQNPSISVIPPLTTLRAAQRAMPSEANPGWYGTLEESRGAALRDDTTIYINPTAAAEAPLPTPAPKAITPSALLPALQTPTPAYPATAAGYQPQNFSYANYQQQYRAAYPQYGVNQPSTTGYYGGAYPQGTPQGATTAGAYSGYTNGAQYPYSQWYSNYQTTLNPAATPTRSTAQSSMATNAAATYAAYSTPVRAIANTVSQKSQVNGWPTPLAAGYTGAPAIAQAGGTPAPNVPMTPLAGYSQNYMANFQSTTST